MVMVVLVFVVMVDFCGFDVVVVSVGIFMVIVDVVLILVL